jgi:protein-S-isoprenylcysteine O-methyltransferase Ste14
MLRGMVDADASRRRRARLRVLGVYAFVLLLLLAARPTPLSVSVGFAIVTLGEALRFWAAGHLRKSVELVTSGPYRYTRNPMYLGRLIIFSGICVMARLPYFANLVVLLVGWILFFGYYLPRKERVEPARLARLHGATYERYHAEVPALFPRSSPYADVATRGWSSDRFLRNREHWMAAGLIGLSLLLLWISYGEPGGLLGRLLNR